MAKAKIPVEEKFTHQDIDLFGALEAIDRKDYGYYDRLTDDQKKKFVPFMLLQWMSSSKGSNQRELLQNVNRVANRYLFNEYVQKHPKLQWLMLCSASINKGKMFHQYVPQLSSEVKNLRNPTNIKDATDFFTKIYPKANQSDIKEFATMFVEEHSKKCYLAQVYPNLKLTDIEILSQMVTHEDIKQDKRDRGN